MQPPELRRRLHAEFLAEPGLQQLVRPKGVGLTTRPVERDHELSGQAFLQWATDEQRTSRQGETVDVTITPGQRRTVSSNPRTLPSSLGPFQGPAGQILNPSSKGDYLVTVSVEAITTNASGDEVKTQVYSQQVPFKIVA